MTLTDADILARLIAVEDGTVERKTYSDNRDWIKAVVAFSNTLAIDQPGVLFVGVHDNGKIQEPSANFEDLQKKISGELSNIYPPVYPTILVRDKDGKKFVAVTVYGSPDRPHFAGKSFVRDGTQTKDASETQIQEFIAKRSGKVAEILKWKGREITMRRFGSGSPLDSPIAASMRLGQAYIVDACNQHWLTVKPPNIPSALLSAPLERVELSYDHKENRLMLNVYLD